MEQMELIWDFGNYEKTMEMVLDENQSEDDFESKFSSNVKAMVNLMIQKKKLQLIMQKEYEHTT
jgi:hypothetical protein